MYDEVIPFFGRFGELMLTTDERQWTPTHLVEPGADAVAQGVGVGHGDGVGVDPDAALIEMRQQCGAEGRTGWRPERVLADDLGTGDRHEGLEIVTDVRLKEVRFAVEPFAEAHRVLVIVRIVLDLVTAFPGNEAGGVIGHQFGGGRGRDVATVVGALGGGYAGNQVQGAMQNNDVTTSVQQRCKTVYDKSQKMLGYDVTYKIGNQQGKIRMDHDPGTQIPLDKNGQLVLNRA